MKLPLGEKPYYNSDSIANSLASDDMMDCYLEPAPGEVLITRRRPGLTLFTNLNTALSGDGIYDWESAEKVIAVSGGKVFEIAESGSTTELNGLGEDESPRYSGLNHENWNIGVGWQNPVKNESDENPPIKYEIYNFELGGLLLDADGEKISPYFENGALAKNADGTGNITTVAANTIIEGIQYEVTIYPYFLSGTATYTLGGATGTTLQGKDVIVDTLTTISTEGLIITPANTSRFILKISWKAKLAPRDYPISGTPVIFDDGQDTGGNPWLYMANGRLTYLQKPITTGAATTVSTPLVNVPTDKNGASLLNSTHVAWINSRFIANETDTNKFDFTDTNPLTTLIENNYWTSSDNPVTCDSKGDKLSALFAAWQEIYAWGTQGLQVFQDDGSTPFVNVPGAAAEVGIESIYSIRKADNTILALCVIDNKRVAVKLQGRSPQVISEPIANILSEMETISDAIGDIISVGGLAIWLLNFPTANQTWAYDYKNDIWARWSYWNSTTELTERFIGQHACFVKRWNKHLIMSRVDGKIYEMSRNVFDDDGADMISYRRTRWNDGGDISILKHSKELFIKVKTFANDGTTTPILLVRWRSDGYPVWSNFVEVDLDPKYFGEFIKRISRMGSYRSRQYEFRLSDEVDMALITAEEIGN
jgi:hypothetical protein